MIAPGPRCRGESPPPREILAEVAALLATAYLRLRSPVTATAHVREIEASGAQKHAAPGNQSLITSPGEPSCDGPADGPPARRTT